MRKAVEAALTRAVESMRDNLNEIITVDDMAHAASYSKFHFSRVFRQVTGISPRRFLTALRLQEAKRLLVSTSFTIMEISYQVGYASVGTFGSRFTASVGVPPTVYRQYGGFPYEIPVNNRRAGMATPWTAATVHGHIWSEQTDEPGPIFVGLFPDRLPEGLPAAWTILRRPGAYTLEGMPLGTWYVHAHTTEGGSGDAKQTVACIGSRGPITIRRDTGLVSADMWLRPMRILDPPVLVGLRDIGSTTFERAQADPRPETPLLPVQARSAAVPYPRRPMPTGTIRQPYPPLANGSKPASDACRH